MNDFELRALYDRLVANRATGRGACLAPEALMTLAAGEATEADRLVWLDHVAACRDCRRELELARAVAEAGTGLVSGGRRRTQYFALAASVLILIAGAVVWRSGMLTSDGNVVRGTGDAVSLVAPAGDVAGVQAIALVWRAVPHAVRYDVEVMTNGGALVFGTGVIDTTTAVPGAFLKPGTEYRWRVIAELPDGRRIGSAAQAFRVRAP